MNDLANANDPRAPRIKELWEAMEERELTQQEQDWLNAIEAEFYPKRSQPGYWAPVASCHWSNVWAYYVAKAWRPDGQWKVRKTQWHTTVVDTKNKEIFDVLLHDHTLDDIRDLLFADPERLAA